MPPSRISRVLQVWREIARHAGALAAAALILWGALFPGRAYLFCRMMERPVPSCCCAPDRDGEALAPPGDERPEIGNGCCESRPGGEIDRGHAWSPAPEVAPAAVTAVLPAVPTTVSVAAFPPADTSRRHGALHHPIRAGPRALEESASDACVRLQVFRC